MKRKRNFVDIEDTWHLHFSWKHRLNSPSRSFLTLEQEDQQRIKYTRFLNVVGRHLLLNAESLALAMHYFNAYYLRKPFPKRCAPNYKPPAAPSRHAFQPSRDTNPLKNDPDPKNIACAACLLASKVNSEQRHRVYRVVDVSHYFLYPRRSTPNDDSPTANKMKEILKLAEIDLILTLEFNMTLAIPQQYLQSFLSIIFPDGPESSVAITQQLCMNFSNDSCRLGIALFHYPDLVAMACIQLAFHFRKLDDKNFEIPKFWVENVKHKLCKPVDTRSEIEEEMNLICDRIMFIYEKKNRSPPRNYIQDAPPTMIT